MTDRIMLLCLGMLLIVLGVLNFCGNIRSIHQYNRTRITEENRRPYGRTVGTGSMIIGASLSVTAILEMLIDGAFIYFITLGGCLIGLALILYGQFKYNKGLF